MTLRTTHGAQEDLRLLNDAARSMKSGPSFLHRYLPFWIAVWADRLVVLLIPLVAVRLPVMRLAPSVYPWRIKPRIYRWYGRLKQLEYELDIELVRHRLSKMA